VSYPFWYNLCWNIKYDNEVIQIEDSLPMVQLSRKKKEKHGSGC
jgi:hypothetical protein